MARAHQQTKSNRGKEIACGRCSEPIKAGERYYKWSFRYGGTHYRCAKHPPKQSELTQSNMSMVYEAIETAEESIPSMESGEDIASAVEEVAGVAREVCEQYREAAEPFGGAGENAERADELEGWCDELDQFEVEEDESAIEEFKTQAVEETVAEFCDVSVLDLSDLEAVMTVFQIDEDTIDQRAQELAAEEGGGGLDDAKAAALELIGSCPL